LSHILVRLLLLCFIVLPGCTDRQIYSAIQTNQRNECFMLPESQINQCLERTGAPYDQYQQDRNEALGQ